MCVTHVYSTPTHRYIILYFCGLVYDIDILLFKINRID